MARFAFLVCMLFASFVCPAQNTFTGSVVNEQQQSLAGVTITTGKNDVVAITDTVGHYSFQYASASLSVSLSYIGFITASVFVSNTLPATVILLRNNIYLPETIVNAFERNSGINNTPVAVTVISQAALQRYSSQSLVPALNTVPGVKMDERSPGSYRLSIRGNLLRSTFGVRNVKVYWNGIPFTDANGNTYINQLSLSNISKIEILKGPSGSMYGAGTGGVVLLSTAAPTTPKKEAAIQTIAGSYGLFSANASYDQTGNNSNSVSFSHQQSDGYRSHTKLRRDVANYTGNYRIHEKQKISAHIFYSDLYYQTPGGLTAAEMAANPEQARPAAGAFPGATAQQAAIYLKTIYAGVANEYNFNSLWRNTTSVYASHTDFKNPTIRNYEKKYEEGIGSRTVFQYKGKLFTHTFGGEYQYSFINTSVYGNRLGMKDTLQYHDHIDARQYNAFAQTECNINNNLLLTAGLSYNNFHYGFERVSDAPSSGAASNFTPQFVPRIAALLKVKLMSMYAAISKGYSPPGIDEVHASDGIFNTALKAETGWNYEAGIKGDIVKNKIWIDASYYIFGLQNTIVSRRDSSGADYYVNAGRTDQHGTEAGINYLPVNNNSKFFRTIKLWATYTNIHARFKHYQQGASKYDGNKLTGTPPNVFVAGADVVIAPGIYANITYSYTDKIPLNDANTFFAVPYNLLFIKLGYKMSLGKNVSSDFFIAWERSFNNLYSLGNDLNAAGNRFFNPSAPQNFTAGARFSFNIK